MTIATEAVVRDRLTELAEIKALAVDGPDDKATARQHAKGS